MWRTFPIIFFACLVILMTEIRLCRDDIVPRAVDAGIISKLNEFAAQNKTDVEVEGYLGTLGDPQNLTWDQVKEVLADAILAGISGASTISIYGDSLPEGTARAAAPSSPGTNGTNVWVTPPEGSYTLRFYVEGVLKLEQDNYNLTSLAALGATSGDIIQICQVANDVVGWWARITVP